MTILRSTFSQTRYDYNGHAFQIRAGRAFAPYVGLAFSNILLKNTPQTFCQGLIFQP
ncbi:hypothetical protein GCM10009077_29400 [Roseibium denhamense]|uniref:KTSC domain-containing protein n=1 Tax=Roseibium denhamense TaxID=76305 RepID=A0ABY1NRQ6_9HYPH|nr:hypothetical protein SAMN06265374_1705 [Roseibium denhamense]